MKKWIKYILLVGLIAATSCADLDVENLNEPDKDRAIGTPDDLVGLASGTFRTVYNQLMEYNGLALGMGVMADWNSCSWGNAGMNDLSHEPRNIAFQNDLTYAYFPIIEDHWTEMYKAISAANDIINAIEVDGLELGDNGVLTAPVRAWCTFIQGVAHGYIGLSFDRGNIIDETTDLTALEFYPYEDVSLAGIEYLYETLDLIDAAGTFVLPETFVRGYGEDMDQDFFEQIVRTFLAKLLISWPRNGTEAQQIDWNEVLTVLTSGAGGLETDFNPDNDDVTWINNYLGYQRLSGWGRVDHRIINKMDPDYFSRWPNGSDWGSIGLSDDPGEAESDDARLETDFQYLPDNNFRPDRGHYHFSHYRFSRFDDWGVTWTGQSPFLLAWEAKLIEAEARLRTADKDGAIAILNDATGPRKVRGGLGDVASDATDEEVLAAIIYEKEIECYDAIMGISFFDMRRLDMLQYGTLNHFPVPRTELELVGVPVYTIGTQEPDGWDRALYGWVGLDGQVVPVGGWPGYPDKPAPGPKPAFE
ncbi:MAG TPA: hypothetical protein ENN63_08105 [Bacteroidetes bacterium]|nr:hypothetical protein [Bacteroidota bacterium]